MSKTKPIILFLTMALAGCATPYSETPTASNFPTTSQEKLQAAAHWGLITQDLSQKLQTQMSGKVSKQQPLYVSATDDTPFNQAAVGELSALATGLWALTELNASITPAGVATGVIFAGDAQAYFNSDKASGPTPQTEIIINATVSDNSRYLAVSRATYYAADRDQHQ